MYVELAFFWMNRNSIDDKGGIISYASSITDQINSTVANFSIYSTDHRAGIIKTYAYALGAVCVNYHSL